MLSEAIRLGALAVRGNHDHGALIAFNELCKNREVKNVWKWVQDMTPEQARYIAAMPFIISIPEYRVLAVHAGVVAQVPLQRQRWIDLCNMHNVIVRDHPTIPRIGTKNRERGKSWQQLWKGDHPCDCCHN